MPTEALDEALVNRLKQAENDVAREFAAFDLDVVHAHFERVTGDLLRGATVTDFIPVLARRQVREILKGTAQAATSPAG